MRNTQNDSAATIRGRKISLEVSKKAFRGLSNLDFSRQDDNFMRACDKAGVTPSIRQASKYRNKTGIAYNNK